MDDNQLARLANAGHQLRPDWPVGSLRTFLAKHFAARAYRDVALVLANVATVQPASETPKLMLEDWPWSIVATADRRSDAERHPSGAGTGTICHHCGRTRDHCQDTAVQTEDPHPFATSHDLAVQRARADRNAADRPWDPTAALNPARRIPTHLRQQMVAEIRASQQNGTPNSPVTPRDPGPDLDPDPPTALEGAERLAE